jgi:hypothetical protein
MNEYEKEIFQWLEDAGLNPVHHNMAVPHLEVSAQCGLPTELGYEEHHRYLTPQEMSLIANFLGAPD